MPKDENIRLSELSELKNLVRLAKLYLDGETEFIDFYNAARFCSEEARLRNIKGPLRQLLEELDEKVNLARGEWTSLEERDREEKNLSKWLEEFII